MSPIEQTVNVEVTYKPPIEQSEENNKGTFGILF